MTSQYARINAVKKVFSVLQADLEKSEILRGEDLALELILVEVWLNGKELT
jgi:hypothetical protein